jgi:NACHT domain
LGFPGERTSALNGDHLEIVMFSSREDNNYYRVAGELSRLNKIALQSGKLRDIQEPVGLRESKIDLPSTEASAFDSHVDELDARCHPDTRIDLLGQIKKWAQDPQGKCIFWLNGMAGTGKSTISRTVAQSLANDGQLGASFFFKRGEGERGNASRFFTTITLDLVRKVPGLAHFVRSAIDAEPGISGKSLNEQFEKLIFEPLSKASLKLSTLVIVVDALDECQREGDIRNILRLLLRTRDLQLRIFLTSRPEHPITLEFKKMSRDMYQDVILEKLPHVTIEKDISVFLRDELGMIRDEHNYNRPSDLSLPPDWPGNEKVQALAAIAVPSFIFAATICRFVGDDRWGWNPKKLLDTVLNETSTLASSLDRTYLPVLQHLMDKCVGSEKETLAQEFRDIVGSIVILADPLPTSSLASLLDISKEDVDSRLHVLHSVLRIPSNPDLPVRLLHLSFRDFLIDHKKKENWFWVDAKKTHDMIASKCLELMAERNCLRGNMCDLEFPGKLRSEIDEKILRNRLPPDIQYACQYWVHHLEQGGRMIREHDAVYDFLQRHFLHWLEALSLIGKISQSVALIATLQSLVSVRPLNFTVLIASIRPRETLSYLVFLKMHGGLSSGIDG